MLLKVVENGEHKDIHIDEGMMHTLQQCPTQFRGNVFVAQQRPTLAD